MRHLERHGHEVAGLFRQPRFGHQNLMVAVRQPLHDLGGALLPRKVEEELLDVLNLERALLKPVLLDQILDGHLMIIAFLGG